MNNSTFKYLDFQYVKNVFIFFLLLACIVTTTKFITKIPVWHFSEGERVGVIRKLSKKGYLYPTYEGELMMNAGLGSVKLDTFEFSVPNKVIADSLMNHLSKEVTLHYNQYILVPYRIGGTQYLVDSFKVNESGKTITK